MNSELPPTKSQEQEESQVFIQNCSGNEDDLLFNQIVGALQSIVIDPEFVGLQDKFMREHCEIFEQKEENKMEYMEVFQSYQTVIEKHILNILLSKIPNFTMERFSQLLATRTDQIDEELLEMMNSFTQFLTFKQLMLQYKGYYREQEKFCGLTIKGSVIGSN